jgi:hypothetical protein
MQEPPTELAAYSGPWRQGPDADLLRLTAAAQAAGHGQNDITDACDNGPGKDIPGVIRQQYWIKPDFWPGPRFSATQRAVRKLGHRPRPGRRPVYAERGHAAGVACCRTGCVRGWTATRRWPAGPPARLYRSRSRLPGK